jgi:cytochrome c551/c552
MRTTAILLTGALATALSGCSKAPDGKSVSQDRDPYLAMNTVLVANACSNCHAVDYVRVGPAIRDVAELYAEAGPEDKKLLAESIVMGAKGKWGPAVMPAQHQVTPKRADEIVSAILALNAQPAPSK